MREGGYGIKSMIKKLKKVSQPVSCLYSDHIYKSTRQGFLQKMQMDSYKQLYLNQQIQNNKLFVTIEELKSVIKKLQLDKETLNFAYKALQVKLKYQNQLLKQLEERGMTQAKGKRKIIPRKTVKISHKVIQQTPIKSHKQIQKIINQSEKENAYISKTSPQIILLSVKDSQLEKGQDISMVQLEQQYILWQQEYKKKAEENFIEEKKKHIEEVEQKNMLILQNKQKIQELEMVKVQYEMINQEKTLKIEQLKYQNQVTRNNFQKLIEQKDIKVEEYKIQIEEYQKKLNARELAFKQRQMRQEQQVKLLKKFGQELKINDLKIKQFMNEEFGEEVSKIPATQKASYKEKISYLLHLTKKKEEVYSKMAQGLRQRIRQSCYINEVIQSKLDFYIKTQKAIKEMVDRKEFQRLNYFMQQQFY